MMDWQKGRTFETDTPEVLEQAFSGRCSMSAYYVPGARKIRGQRITIADRVRMRRARKRRERMWLLF